MQLAAALVTCEAVNVRRLLESGKTHTLGYMDKDQVLCSIVTFMASLYVYDALFIMFGGGGGMPN